MKGALNVPGYFGNQMRTYNLTATWNEWMKVLPRHVFLTPFIMSKQKSTKPQTNQTN